MSSLPRARFTPQPYLALERAAETKSEFFNGEIFAMAGTSRENNLIAANVVSELRAQLKGRPCETYPGDMRVKVSETGLYTYPDIVVVCREPRFEDEHGDTLLNPTLVIEVLSPSTEAYDRGEKPAHYRRIASLAEYLLIAQDRCHGERYTRRPDGQWLLAEARGLDQSIPLNSIGGALALADVYDRVSFDCPERAADPRGSDSP